MVFKIILALAFFGAALADNSKLPVLYRVDQDHSNVVVFRGADVAKARAAGLISGGSYKPVTPAPPTYPTTTYAPPTTTTKAYVPPPPKPTYKPRPVYRPVYKPALQPAYKPLPAPTYKPVPAPTYKPVVVPAYKPVVPAYKPVVATYKPAPYTEVYADVVPNYNWEYAVLENYNDFGHKEGRDGYATQGVYYVNLPDGRVQTVTYVADADGYRPEISYTGEAQYPAEQPKTGYHA